MARDGALVISTASASHSGDFKCVATNEAGSVERKTRLKVNGENLIIAPSLLSLLITTHIFHSNDTNSCFFVLL